MDNEVVVWEYGNMAPMDSWTDGRIMDRWIDVPPKVCCGMMLCHGWEDSQ